MSAMVQPQAAWLSAEFWEQLDRVEGQHRRVQIEYETIRRQLDRLDPKSSVEFQHAWARYCEILDELDRATGDLELLRLSTI